MTYDGRAEGRFTIPAAGSVIAVTNGAGGPTNVTVAGGAYYISTFIVALQAALIAQRPPSTGTWVVTLSLGPSGTGQIAINCTQVAGTWSITWTDTIMRDMLGFTANIVAVNTAQTGTKQARGLWRPECTIDLDGDPSMAPQPTDARACIGPGGVVQVLESNKFFRHTGIVWSHVPLAYVKESAAAIANASWEVFWKDVQLGEGGLSWFAPGSKLQIYTHTGIKLGIDANGGAGVSGWVAAQGPFGTEVKKSVANWVGFWRIDLPELISDG